MVGFHEVADLRHDRSAYNGDGCGEYSVREGWTQKGPKLDAAITLKSKP